MSSSHRVLARSGFLHKASRKLARMMWRARPDYQRTRTSEPASDTSVTSTKYYEPTCTTVTEQIVSGWMSVMCAVRIFSFFYSLAVAFVLSKFVLKKFLYYLR